MKAEEFGEYIRGLRKRANLTIRQVELYSGVSNAYLSQLENGKRNIPSPDILQKLSRPLKTPYEELMTKAGYLSGTRKVTGNPPIEKIAEEDPRPRKELTEEELNDMVAQVIAWSHREGESEERPPAVRKFIEEIVRETLRAERNLGGKSKNGDES